MPPAPPTPDDLLLNSLARLLVEGEPADITKALGKSALKNPGNRKGLGLSLRALGSQATFGDFFDPAPAPGTKTRGTLRPLAVTQAKQRIVAGVIGPVRNVNLMLSEALQEELGSTLSPRGTVTPDQLLRARRIASQGLQATSQEQARRVGLLRRISKLLRSGKFSRAGGGLAGAGLLLLITLAAQAIGGSDRQPRSV